MTEQVKPCEMKLADVVQLFDAPFGHGIVHQIKDNIVYVFRPYAVTADFSYTGGVIPYIGMETVELSTTSQRAYRVIERKTLR